MPYISCLIVHIRTSLRMKFLRLEVDLRKTRKFFPSKKFTAIQYHDDRHTLILCVRLGKALGAYEKIFELAITGRTTVVVCG